MTPAARSLRRIVSFDKPWWRVDRSWVALASDTPYERQEIVGAVTLALREGMAGAVPVVHWLLVDLAWRRHGIGRLLTSHLEPLSISTVHVAIAPACATEHCERIHQVSAR